MKRFFNFAACTALTVILSVLTACSQLNEGNTGTIIFDLGGGSARTVTGQRSTLAEAFGERDLDKIYLDFTISGDYPAKKQTVSFSSAIKDGVKFENIPAGAAIVCSCDVYRVPGPEAANFSVEYLYGGTSGRTIVKSGENTVNIGLKKYYTLYFFEYAELNQLVLSGQKAKKPADPVKKNGDISYLFLGWYHSPYYAEKFDFNIPITFNVSILPKWLVKIYGATVSEEISGSDVFTTSSIITIPDMYVCEHEVTQAEYETYCYYGSTTPNDGGNYPARYLNWYDAIVYCNLRSIAEDLTPVYTISGETDPSKWSGIQEYNGKYFGPSSENTTWDAVTMDSNANGYRLPTEAEWEYLARGGNNGIPENECTYTGYEEGGPHEVKTREANFLGLYDMCGNVWEFCYDSVDNKTKRRVRGGNWKNTDGANAIDIKSYQFSSSPSERNQDFGFRVVRNAN